MLSIYKIGLKRFFFVLLSSLFHFKIFIFVLNASFNESLNVIIKARAQVRVYIFAGVCVCMCEGFHFCVSLCVCACECVWCDCYNVSECVCLRER